LIALRSGPGDAQAAVTLLYFRGQHNGGDVLLEWATATELNTAYFYLERADQQDGPYQILDDIGLVPSEAPPDGLSGATYQRTDEDGISDGQEYWYVLVEVESGQGTENRTQPIRIAFADAQPTSTVTQAPTATPTATPTQQSFGLASATPTATPTATVASSGQSATPTTGRTVPMRATATSSNGQPNAAVSQSDQTATGQAETIAQVQESPTQPASSYPKPDTEAPIAIAQSEPDGYPASPPTPRVLATNSYPARTSPVDLTNGDGTPLPNIGANRDAQLQGLRADSGAPTNSPLMGTLFLWLGFLAALVVFISAVIGAIYYYSRQRSTDN
jgi:hypothetical protein